MLKHIDTSVFYHKYFIRCVAQPGSASALGAEGRRFEPCHTDQSIQHLTLRGPAARSEEVQDWRKGRMGD